LTAAELAAFREDISALDRKVPRREHDADMPEDCTACKEDPAAGMAVAAVYRAGICISTDEIVNPDALHTAAPGTVWDLVVHDMHGRDALGLRKYGRPLRPHDGRDTLQDAYEEALDLAVYLRKAMLERDGK
jgi:hypothetical protein